MKTFITIIMMVIAFGYGYAQIGANARKAEPKQFVGKSVEERVAVLAKEMNKICPYVLDEITQVVSVQAKGRELTVNTDVALYSKSTLSQAEQNELFQYMYKVSKEGACTNGIMRPLLDKGAKIHYNYTGDDNRHLMAFYVEGYDCKAVQ